MRHRIAAARGRIMRRFKADFGPPAIPPVIALLAAFEALLSALFAPVRLSRMTQSKVLISFGLLVENNRFWGAKEKIPPVICRLQGWRGCRALAFPTENAGGIGYR